MCGHDNVMDHPKILFLAHRDLLHSKLISLMYKCNFLFLYVCKNRSTNNVHSFVFNVHRMQTA